MKRALIVVDLQNDFVSGALAVNQAAEIIPLINQLLNLPFDIKVATKDWHPKNHLSFATSHPGKKVGDVVLLKNRPQILWPDHCVENSWGAEFVEKFDHQKIAKVFYKGTNTLIDSYSTFFDNDLKKATGLDDYLKDNGIQEIYLAGLATDYCVKYSSLDGKKLGYKTFVIKDACRAVNLKPDDERLTYQAMEKAGIQLIHSQDILWKNQK
jgi:nicotinamidase/pyrazinamidase